MSLLLPPIATWEQWAALFDDVRVWRPVVDAICEREGIVYHRIEAPASNTNAVFILDRRVVMKIYSPFWEECAFERRLMELLQHDAAVPVPAIRAAGRVSGSERLELPRDRSSAPDVHSMSCRRR